MKNINKKFSVFLKIILNSLLVFAFIICSIVLVYKFIYIETPVIGASMYPTLNNTEYNDTALINSTQKGDVGDIIVLDLSKTDITEDNSYIIKRIIATEGQRVDLRYVDDKLCVFVDNIALQEDYTTNDAFIENGNNPYLYRAFTTYLTTHTDSIDYNSEGLLIPEGMVFIMGDNRKNSTDSATFGPVPVEAIVGRVDAIVKHGESKVTKILQAWVDIIF